MARGDGTYAPKSPYEMSCREARQVAREIHRRVPTLEAEVWAIAQGLAYIKVTGPTTRGVLDLVLHDRLEAETLLELTR